MSDLTDFISSLTPAQKNELLKDLLHKKQTQNQASQQAQYRTPAGIVRFVREVLKADPAPYQTNILESLIVHKRVAVRGPHGLGKTALASWVVLWGLLAHSDDVKVVTTASAWRQLDKYLWPEIRKWAGPMRQKHPELTILTLTAKMPGKQAFAVASDDPALIEGAHAKTLIYVFDEAKAIPSGTWDAAEGAFSGAGEDTEAEAYALAISTPGEPSGRFYDIHTHKPGLQDWHTIHVTLQQAIDAGRISRGWADKRREQWGEHSAVYQNRVLGEFDASGEDSVIPLAWVELANERWHNCDGKGDGPTSYGVDPARYGRDNTAIAKLTGCVIEKVDYSSQEDTMQTAGRVAARVDKQTPVAVDVIGIGAGVADRLKELQYKVTGVNVSESATDEQNKPLKDSTGLLEFFNLRSYILWRLRDALNPDNPAALALPPDDKLTGDLTAPKYTYTSKGQIKVESKDELRKRLGRSTDGGDAVGLALFISPLGRPVRDDPVRFARFVHGRRDRALVGTALSRRDVRRLPQDMRKRRKLPRRY